jgi:hypothetical protein
MVLNRIRKKVAPYIDNFDHMPQCVVCQEQKYLVRKREVVGKASLGKNIEPSWCLVGRNKEKTPYPWNGIRGLGREGNEMSKIPCFIET